jgi:D-alanyl-D-alanine carboxypeptidase
MLLRRVIEHVREQNWSAIGIDFVIVVVGVFIGIQVSNWNGERVTERQAAKYTANLEADLREEAWRYQLIIEYNVDVLAASEIAVNALTGIVPLSDQELLISAYRATQYRGAIQRRSTYDELISTGTIGLIRNPALRETAMRVFSAPTFDNITREALESGYRKAFRMTVPNDVQRTLNRDCGDRLVQVGDYDGITEIIDYPCEVNLPPAQVAEAVRALRAESSLVPLLRLRIADLDTRLTDLQVTNGNIMRALQAVAERAP